MEYEVESISHDKHGRYYELEADAPFAGVTVNELDDTVTFHEPAKNATEEET